MIKDNIKLSGFDQVKIPKIKGHVKIELKDVITKKTDVVFEGDNMITHALRDIFASNYAGAMDYRKLLPIYSKMLGGVLCFRDVLDTSSADAADDYFIPDNSVNQVTAHAGQTTLSDQADDVKRGNPLSTAMTIADGAVTLAWEWGSTAGNGIISSVALTHSDVGDAGTGSDSDAFLAMKPNINANYGMTPEQVVLFVDDNGYGYSFNTSGTTVTITRFPMAYKKVGLVGLPYDYVAGIQKTKNISVQTDFGSNAPFFCFLKKTNKLYLFYNESKSNSVNVDVINLSNWDSIPTPEHAVWSNLDAQVGPLHIFGNTRMPNVLPYANGYVYLPQFSALASDLTGYLKVNLNSIADQTFVSGSEVGKMVSGIFIPNTDHRVIAGKNFVINNDVLYKASIETPDELYYFDYSGTLHQAFLDQGESLVGLTYLRGNSVQYYPSISKFYLGTKFNLPTPIQKSNTQSMVVTYTLTEVEENAE